MLLKVYKLNKRINSTLLPTDADLVLSGEVLLKDSTSVDEPSFVMACSQADMVNARNCNYAEYDGMFLWIKDIIQINNAHIEFDCKVDVLATYKQYILASRADVMFSTQGNVHTVDTRISVKATNKQTTTFVSMSDTFVAYPSMLIEAVNGTGYTFDTPYLLTGAEVQFLKAELVTPDFLTEMKMYFDNPMEMIIRAQLTAANVGNLDTFGSFERIQVGGYSLEAKGHRFAADYVIKKFHEIKIPWNYSDFRNRKPYTMITLYMPFVGLVELDAARLYNTKTIGVNTYIEVLTGQIIYELYADDPKGGEEAILIETYTGNCNTTTPIARQSWASPIQATTSAAAIAAGLVMENPIITAAGIGKSLETFQQHCQINGALSSALSSKILLSLMLTVWSCDTNDTPDNYKDVKGLPYGSTVELSKLSGYCQTVNASISAPAMPKEIEEINNYLNGGIYIE